MGRDYTEKLTDNFYVYAGKICPDCSVRYDKPTSKGFMDVTPCPHCMNVRMQRKHGDALQKRGFDVYTRPVVPFEP